MVAPATPIGRSLPHSLEAEEFLLSCCLLDGPSVISSAIMAGISPDSWYDQKHAIVFGVILDLYSAQKNTDVSVVAEELKTRRQLDAVGGYAFLTQVSSRIPTTAQAGYFIEKVREQALLRQIIRSRTGSVEDCYGFSGDIEGFVAELQAKEASVFGHCGQNNEESVAEVCDALLADLKLPKSQRNASRGLVSFGLPDIDRYCGMMAPGDLVILAGMPSSGKSALCDQAVWACAESGRAVVELSLEMSVSKKVVRLAQQISRVNLKQFDEVPMDYKTRFTDAIRKVKGCKHLHILEKDRTLARFQARCRTIHQKSPLGLIAVDFLQYLARLEPSIGKEPMAEKIGRLTAGLKSLGSECGCPVLLLSSLNRDGYREGGVPNLASLKASGEIESDADVVQMLHWPSVNPKTGQKQDPLDHTQGTFYADLLQLKGRDNGVAQTGLMFTRAATRWDGVAR